MVRQLHTPAGGAVAVSAPSQGQDACYIVTSPFSAAARSMTR